MQHAFQTAGRQRGIALIAVLWLSVLLALIAMTANRTSRAEVAMAANARSAFKAQQVAESAMDVAIFTYATGEDGAWYADGTVYGWVIDDVAVRVAMTDERWRVDLNTASEAALTEMFEDLGQDEASAAARAAEVLAYREAARSSLPRVAAEAQLQEAGFFAFGLVEEISLATDMDDALVRRVAEVATVYTGLAAPQTKPARSMAANAEADEATTDLPVPLTGLSERPPERSDILRVRAEARTTDGAHHAREAVVFLGDIVSREPYALRMLRQGEQELFHDRE